MSENLHGGHRERMRRRYLEQGLEGMADHEALELLLYHAIPRSDVNPLAHRLLNRFGSLKGVLDATVEQLREVEGVGESTALLLTLVRDLQRRYLIQAARKDKRPILSGGEDAGRFFLPYFHGIAEERVYVAFLDDVGRLISCRQLFEGGIDAVPVSIRKILESALQERATTLILAHNHPGGQAMPSVEDRLMTERIALALDTISLHLMDHIIVAGQEYLSMVDNGFFAVHQQ